MSQSSHKNPPDEDTSNSETDNSEPEPRGPARVISLLPVHAAPNSAFGKDINVSRRAGRQPKVERRINLSDLEYHAEIAKQRTAYVETDPVVKSISSRADTSDALQTIMLEIAKEAASLQFQRIENEKFGRDTAVVSSRRIEALKKISDIALDAKKIGAERIDFKGEKMQRVFAFFVDQIREVAVELLSPEQIDLLFNRLTTQLESWEDKCEDITSTPKE